MSNSLGMGCFLLLVGSCIARCGRQVKSLAAATGRRSPKWPAPVPLPGWDRWALEDLMTLAAVPWITDDISQVLGFSKTHAIGAMLCGLKNPDERPSDGARAIGGAVLGTYQTAVDAVPSGAANGLSRPRSALCRPVEPGLAAA